MRRLVVGGIACLMLAGCETFGDLDADKELLIMCEAFAGALSSIAPFKPQLSQGTIDSIDAIRAEVNPICLDADFRNVDEAIGIVQGSVLQILRVREKKSD